MFSRSKIKDLKVELDKYFAGEIKKKHLSGFIGTKLYRKKLNRKEREENRRNKKWKWLGHHFPA